MPENDATANAGENGESQKNGFIPPASQEELDRIIQRRIDREREKFSDYGELKSQAERVPELESQVTELNEKVTGFEQEKERDGLIKSVAETHGVPASALRGSTEEELTAHAETLKDLLKPSAPVVEGQARSPGETPRDLGRETVKKLFGNE